MALFDTTQLGLEAAIRASAVRQQAIAQTLANANTPGYRRVDVDFAGALGAAMQKQDGKALDGFVPAMKVDDAAPVRVDGSSVDIDRENAESAKNGILYESLVAVARTRQDIIRSAIGVG
jgi:flagellar basal-body rod protein FlgB